jgi:lysozyme
MSTLSNILEFVGLLGGDPAEMQAAKDRRETEMQLAKSLSSPKYFAETIRQGLLSPDVPANNTSLLAAPSSAIESFKNEIRSAEGFRDKAYIPVKGDVPTIGYGFTSGVKKGDTMTKEEAEKRLDKEVNDRLFEIRNALPEFDDYPEAVQTNLLSSWYRGSLVQSPKTRNLLNQGKFNEAAKEFLNNDEYRNAVKRGRRGIRKRMEQTADAIRSLASTRSLL